ncbi:MAG TPA: redoxin domain-containing protein [Thermomicrobiales bacterium]|nr:redoxin domain-containing protein [Thermomicrobiales bacterium]
MQTTNLSPTLHGPATGKMLRPFAGQTTDGQTIRSQSYRQRSNLVLLFHHGRDCAPCQAMLADIGAHIDEIQDQATAVLAIGPDGEARPFPMLTDPSGEIAKQQGLAAPAVVIVDRFGEIWAAWEGGADHHLPHADDVIEWLEFLEVQCPECEPPEPWGDE